MSSELSANLTELRVVDLRAELEKRGLDKSGNKQVLLERLQKAMEDENTDETTFEAVKGEDGDSKLDSTQNGDSCKKDADETGEDDSDLKETDKVCKKEVSIKTDSVASDMKISSKVDSKEDSKQDKGSDKKVIKTPTKDAARVEEKTPTTSATAEVSTVKSMEKPKKITAERKNSKSEDSAASKQQAEAKNQVEPKKVDNSNSKTDTTKPAAPKGSPSKPTEGKITPVTAPSPSKTLAKDKKVIDQNRNLWITNISQNTRATELKQALSEHGKVVGAKVVINARHPQALCYGYVKLETVADANNCILKLNNTELNGQIIRIEKVRPDHLNPLKNKVDSKEKDKAHTKAFAHGSGKPDAKADKKVDSSKEATATGKDDKKADKTTESKDKDAQKKSDAAIRTPAPKVRAASRDKKGDDQQKSTSRERQDRSLSAKSSNRVGRERERDVLTFDKIKDEREREREREKERIIRDRRREEAARQKQIERHQRSESIRLEREREKLKRERERLERERAELMSFERERQKAERQKLEMDRIELERVKLRMQEEERRATKRPAPTNYRERSYEDRKRIASDRHFDEAPPPPRFEPPPSLKIRDSSPTAIKKFSSSSSVPNKEYAKQRLSYDKRDSYPKRDYDERSNVPRPPPVPKYDGNSSYSGRGDPRVRDANNMTSSSKYVTVESKVTRYNERERDRSPHFRNVRDERERRPISDNKSDNVRPSRYPENKEPVRFDRTSSGGGGGGGWSNNQKVYNPSGNTPANKQWGGKESWRSDNSSNNDRWNSSNNNRGTAGMSSTFSSTSINLGPSCPPPPGINNYVNDRFDYKNNMNSMRKY